MKLPLSCLAMFSILSLFGCESRKTLAEVDFENSKFGLEYIPDRSLEGYNEKYHPFFQAAGASEKKFILKDEGFMFGTFPKSPSLLEGIDVIIVDTIPRTYEKYDETVAITTLYIDPKVFDKSQWQTFSRFVKKSYSQSDSSNELLRWLNYGYNIAGKKDTLYVFNTIYALVYANVSGLEPEYKSPDGKRSLKVGVDEQVYFKDLSEQSPGWLGTGKLTDSVFHYWIGRKELVNEFAGYERDGKKFSDLYKITEPQE
jgi:hypothetical protein